MNITGYSVSKPKRTIEEMTTTLINPRKRGRKADTLTVAQKIFCEEMAADPQMNVKNAATKAGYKRPSTAGAKLLKNPIVRGYLGKVLFQRIERCQLIADDVLEMLRNVLYLDPIELFEKTPEGAFLIRDLDEIPQAIRRCITKLKSRARELPDGTIETYLEVDLMSKDSALNNAMKHLGLQGEELQEKMREVEVGNNPYLNADPKLLLEAKQVIFKLQQSSENGNGRAINGKAIPSKKGGEK